MVSFQFEVQGEEQVSRMLSRTTEKLEDLGPFWDAAGDMLITTMEAQFSSEGGRTGGWAPLSSRYAVDKARKYGSQPILVASGGMRQSLVGGPGNISRQEQGGLLFGTEVKFARYHQSGTSRMPQRRILDLTDQDRRSIMKLLQRHLFGAKL